MLKEKSKTYLIIHRLWSVDSEYGKWSQDDMFVVPSDSTLRTDLGAIISNDFVTGQKFKDDYENVQRKDKKLREANKVKK
jgi:hypothetical protein